MKIMATFKCTKCDEIKTIRIDNTVESIVCKCGSDSIRQLSAPKYFGNSVGRSPSAVS